MANRRELTASEKASAARAHKLWRELKRREKISQQAAAERIGITASGFNQYINGKIPLNTDATARLAGLFGVHPRDIDPDWLKDRPGLGLTDQQLSEQFEAILAKTDFIDDSAAIEAISKRVSREDAIKFARIFLERAGDAGRAKQ